MCGFMIRNDYVQANKQRTRRRNFIWNIYAIVVCIKTDHPQRNEIVDKVVTNERELFCEEEDTDFKSRKKLSADGKSNTRVIDTR